MKITENSYVELDYRLLDEDGALVESSEDGEAMTYVHGSGEIPPGLEKALFGREVGSKVSVTLAPEDAFGAYDPEGIVSVPREEFAEDVELVPGEIVMLTVSHEGEEECEDPDHDHSQDEEGEEEMEMRLVEVSPDGVILDANHPLAGHTVTFDVTVRSIGEAPSEN